MCQHRTHSRWSKAWDAWVVGALGSFLAIEATAFVLGGDEATLTAYSRRALGLNPRCRHAALGRTALIATLTWIAVHLTFGVLPRPGWWDREH